MPAEILIVDDEEDIRSVMTGILADEGYKTRQAHDSTSALGAIADRRPNLVLLDIWLHGSEKDGLDILKIIARDYPDVPVVMISGHGNVETAVTSIKLGAYDYIEKPFKASRLLLVAQRAIEAARLKTENDHLRQRAGQDNQLLGKSAAIAQLQALIARVAPTGSRVLITGAPGTGKEVVARQLHALSKRAEGPFVVVNCAALGHDRIERELFGVDAGGETPGSPPKVGTFELAHGGTLLLDEVSDMPLETQAKIVRVLQDQSFLRVGGSKRIEIDVRVIATTNRELDKEITAGRFREDLYYRLNVVPIRVPALAERREDIRLLIQHFLDRAAQIAGLPPRRLSEEALVALETYDWPGNVRQLRNVADWILIMNDGDSSEPVSVEGLPPETLGTMPAALTGDRSAEVMSLPLRGAREAFEREYLLAQVRRFGGNISRTAAFIGMERSALHRKLKSLGVRTDAKTD
ncbi:MAG: sigma-54 dependent transcriptional regulator [Alphaproteobacteria bacterium]